MNTSYTFRALKSSWLITTVITCVVMAALSLTAWPTRAGDAEDKARKAFADWKAANKAVADAKDNLEKARKKLQTEMNAATGSKKKTPAQEKQLEDARAEVAAAEAALEKAEAALVAARVALEQAIAELPDGELKDQLKRERNFPSLVAANGLYTVKFETSAGQLTVNLPDDMSAGDTISGTVVAEPKGNTAEERAKNTAELSGYVVELNSPKPRNESDKRPPPNVMVLLDTAKSNGFKITLPDTKTERRPLDVNLRQLAPGESSKFGAPNFFPLRENETAPGKIILTSIIPYLDVTEPKAGDVVASTKDFDIPKLVQQGRPLEISGPFDGDFSNTKLKSSLQDFEKNTENVSGGFGLLAESQRKAVFDNSTNVTGPIQLTLNEGNKETKGTYRNVGVNLTAPKTNLLKGEKTELKIEVSGLQGIKEPVPLTLESRGVITMQGGVYQPLVIQPSHVSADGRYSTTREVTGVRAGGWSATATVVTHAWSMDVKMEDENCARRLSLNSSTGDYTFNCPGCSYMMSDGTLMTREQFAVFSIVPIGRGTVTQKGCILTLEHNAPEGRVMATIDQCAKTGTAMVDVPANKAKFTITDRDTANNTCAVQ